MSVNSRLLLWLSYKLSNSIYAVLPALHNLIYASAVEVRSSSLQPASHGFMNCLVSLTLVLSQVSFKRLEQVVVWGGQNRGVGCMEEQFPAVLLNFLQGQTCSVRPRAVMLKDDSFLIRTFFTKRTTKFVECHQFLWLLSFGLVWWARRLFACCAHLQQFPVDHSAAARRCPCFRP
jgi:hypothetical protein